MARAIKNYARSSTDPEPGRKFSCFSPRRRKEANCHEVHSVSSHRGGPDFLPCRVHTIGGVFGDVAPGPAATAVQAMKVNQFLVMGHMRSFWDFYHGFGLGISISL